MKLTLAQAAHFMGATGDFDRAAVACGYSIDSRTLQPGELFFAVRGERLDGHDFVDNALRQGAVAAVVSHQQLARLDSKARLLIVDDTLAALQASGAAVRKAWGKRLIAVTGSAGKTTTKEAIAVLLGTRFRVLKSEGNLNNHFGLPLQLLHLQPEHELAVVELGMSHAGEIAALAHIARPDVGVVTCVAPVHAEFFTSIAGIAKAKYELIEALAPTGIAVLNADDEYVSQFGRDFPGKVVTFGLQHPADVRAEDVDLRGALGSAFDLAAGGRRVAAQLPLLGRHNIYNTLAAVATALECGLTLEQAAAALALLSPADKRGQMLQLGGALVINDCYNCNPKALEAMVDTLAQMQPPGGASGRRIVVAGAMLELGPASDELHRGCGRYIAERGIDLLLGVRGPARHTVLGAQQAGMHAEYVEAPEEAGEWLAREVRPGDSVLLKASRGVKLEQALETWKARLGVAAPPKKS